MIDSLSLSLYACYLRLLDMSAIIIVFVVLYVLFKYFVVNLLIFFSFCFTFVLFFVFWVVHLWSNGLTGISSVAFFVVFHICPHPFSSILCCNQGLYFTCSAHPRLIDTNIVT